MQTTSDNAVTNPLRTDERLYLQPLRLGEAYEFVRANHRHHAPPQGGLFAIGLAINGRVVGCCIVGRPVARMLDDGWTCEVTRLCVTEARNGCSMLYRAAWRAARAMGYKRLITYTLQTESGASLRGAGFKLIGACGGGTWNRPRCGRVRVDKHPLQLKLRWEISDEP